MKHIIGIDFGATSIKGGLIESQNIIKMATLDTKSSEGGSVTMNVLKDTIRQLKTDDTTAVGIGIPSVVDSEKGIAYDVQNIKGWKEVNVKSLLEEEFNVPVFINNDANCFAMGERIYGLGRDFEHFVGITLGTGVGGGIIQKGKLLSDANCGSGEFGEIPYLNGKLEEYCGSFFFTNNGSTGYQTALAAEQGDINAIRMMETYGSHIAALVKIIVLTIDPQAIIFGGSITQSWRLFKEAMYTNLSDFPYPKSIEKLQILPSKLNQTGILGAAALCY